MTTSHDNLALLASWAASQEAARQSGFQLLVGHGNAPRISTAKTMVSVPWPSATSRVLRYVTGTPQAILWLGESCVQSSGEAMPITLPMSRARKGRAVTVPPSTAVDWER